MSALSSEKMQASAFDDAVGRARDFAPFLAMLLQRDPEFSLASLASPVDVDPSLPPAVALRRARRRVALSVAIGDLAGIFDLTEVTHRLSDFADKALDLAIQTALVERYPDAEPRGFAAIALGKQGSRELNYSSDIDPIFLFDPATLPTRRNEEPVLSLIHI